MRRKWLEDAKQVVVVCLDVRRVREGNSTGTPSVAWLASHAALARNRQAQPPSQCPQTRFTGSWSREVTSSIVYRGYLKMRKSV